MIRVLLQIESYSWGRYYYCSYCDNDCKL